MKSMRRSPLLRAGATAFLLFLFAVFGCAEIEDDVEVTQPEAPVTNPPPAASEHDMVGQPPPEERGDEKLPLYNPVEPIE